MVLVTLERVNSSPSSSSHVHVLSLVSNRCIAPTMSDSITSTTPQSLSLVK